MGSVYRFNGTFAFSSQSLHRHLDQVINVPNLNEFSSPVVLVFTGNTTTKCVHRGVTLLAAAFCAWKIFEAYK